MSSEAESVGLTVLEKEACSWSSSFPMSLCFAIPRGLKVPPAKEGASPTGVPHRDEADRNAPQGVLCASFLLWVQHLPVQVNVKRAYVAFKQ